MKFYISPILLFFLIFGCTKKESEICSISPSNPKVGDQIIVVYHSDNVRAKLKNASEIICEALIVRDNEEPLLIETPLEKKGDKWHGTFTLNDNRATLIIFRFVSEEIVDNNRSNPWTTLVYNKEGKPVQGAHYNLGLFRLNGELYEFKTEVNIDQAIIEFEKEKTLYPSSWNASNLFWKTILNTDTSESTRKKITSEIRELLKQHSDDDEFLYNIINVLPMLHEFTQYESLKTLAITRNPFGRVAKEQRLNEIWSEHNSEKKISLMEEFLADFPEAKKDVRDYFHEFMINYFIQSSKIDKIENLLASLQKPNADLLNSAAWQLIEKNKHLKKAVTWAKQAVELSRFPPEKPSYISVKKWKEQNKYELAMCLDTYAYGLYKLGKYVEAESIFDESFRLTQGMITDISLRYMEVLLKNKKYDKAFEVGLDCYKKTYSTDVLTKTKFAFSLKEGAPNFEALQSEKQKIFDEMIAEVKKENINEMRTKFAKTRIDEPAPDFTLKDLDNNVVSLSSLRGKVVVLDFWATWCTPCIKSLPYLQKVHEKFKYNNKVMILAVHTFTTESYDKQKETIKKFMEINRYTFPVVIDPIEPIRHEVANKYLVRGIPSKFVIDTKGNIAWKSIGFEGEIMEDNLIQQIQILLDEAILM